MCNKILLKIIEINYIEKQCLWKKTDKKQKCSQYLACPVWDSVWFIQLLYTSTGFVFIKNSLSSRTSLINGCKSSRKALCPLGFLLFKMNFISYLYFCFCL